jgi:aspartyl protease family protein
MTRSLTKLLIILIFVSLIFSCSKSGRRKVKEGSNRAVASETPRVEVSESGEKTIVKIKKVNGVYEIPTEINGVEMYFIFDTGAGLISISETEAIFLYKQGKLSEQDIIGKANFSDANGDISEGTIINLKTVKIGNRVLENIQASVVHNLGAPLLMGQSALEKFGKISIDYQNSEITFE